MDQLLTKLGEIWGPAGIIIALLVLAVGYLYKRVEALQKENVETLKSVLPLMEKFQQTTQTTLSVLSKKGGEQ